MEATMTDSEIEGFIRSFEDGSLPRSEWTHSRHLLMALWYLRRHGAEAATRLIRDGILRYNKRQGNPTGYHETITLAWVAVVEGFLARRSENPAISALAEALLDECGDKDYLLRFYSRERLFSDEARARWLPPDRCEIR
jgi:hypothetical protein